MYWLLNKKTDTPAIYGGVIAVSEVTGLNRNKLYGVFSRKKLTEFENEDYRIVKISVIKPGQSNAGYR